MSWLTVDNDILVTSVEQRGMGVDVDNSYSSIDPIQ
jgi:hypothetical protein